MKQTVMNKSKARMFLCVLVACASFALSSCFLYGDTSKKLTTYYSESRVIGARFFTGKGEACSTEELDLSRIEELVSKLDSFALKTQFAHTDYFWGGQYGIELSYEDGTYFVYDGTKLYQRRVSVRENFDSEAHLHNEFVSVENADFWKEMAAFFPGAEKIYAR